jgi:hypothetical protein
MNTRPGRLQPATSTSRLPANARSTPSSQRPETGFDFEAFSACNGVYARLEPLADGIDSGGVAFGTTNVDVNQPLHTALAGLARDSLVHVAVGDDALHVATLDSAHVERKVDMPDR